MMDERKMSVSAICSNKITPIDVISISSTKAESLATRNKWQQSLPKIMLIKKRFKVPSEAPAIDIIEKRSEKIEKILLNKCEENPSIGSYAYGFLGIILGVVFTVIVTSYPQHYPIGNSKL